MWRLAVAVLLLLGHGAGGERGGSGGRATGAADTAAAATAGATGDPSEKEGGLVRLFTQRALYAIEASSSPAFVKLDPAGCGEVCRATEQFWLNIAHAVAPSGVGVWRAPCVAPAHHAVCKDRAVPFEIVGKANAAGPVFDIWTGVTWRRYAGQGSPQHLAEYLQSHAYLSDSDPRHVTETPVVKGNNMAYAFAKHKARSPQTDWESLGAPWPGWVPCNPDEAFERMCAPVTPRCTRTVEISQGKRGFGNALFRYAEAAAEVFAQNCTVEFVDFSSSSSSSSSGLNSAGTSPPQNNPFGLAQHCKTRPARVPTKHLVKRGLQPGPCTIYAITQLLPGSLTARRFQAIWSDDDEGRVGENYHSTHEKMPSLTDTPTVALHLRTGWSDTIALHDEWAELQCDSMAAKYKGDDGSASKWYDPVAATMWVVGHVPEFFQTDGGSGRQRRSGRPARVNLTTLIENTVSAADGAFGTGSWKMFVASDSATVKERVAAAVGNRARVVRDVKGRIGHNNVVKDETDAEMVLNVGATTVADFAALRDSDMLIGFFSNFPKRAGQGAVCPQRWYELRSRERPDDVREHVREMDAMLRNTKTDDFIPSEPRPLEEHMPAGHPCLEADDPVHDCACFYKIALGGDIVTEERLRREGKYGERGGGKRRRRRRRRKEIPVENRKRRKRGRRRRRRRRRRRNRQKTFMGEESLSDTENAEANTHETVTKMRDGLGDESRPARERKLTLGDIHSTTTIAKTSATAVPSRTFRMLTGQNILEGSEGLPHVIKVDPAGCERAPGSCNALNGFWNAVARAFPGQVWRLSCEKQPAVCAHHLSIPVPVPGHDPIFEFWSSDSEFSRYEGLPSPDVLLGDIVAFFGRQDDFEEDGNGEDDGGEGGDLVEAYGEAKKAAAEYVRRRRLLRKIEQLLSTGSQSAVQKARRMSEAYLRKYGQHMNAILMAANAAQMDGDMERALSLTTHALVMEPHNARLHARAAAVHLEQTQHALAVKHLEQALSAAPGTHDAEDEEGRARLEAMLRVCKDHLGVAR